MPKCPNCGLDTLRTEDWACQWCGYPLLSSVYKMIPKTYRQLKQERLYEAKPILESKPEPEPEPVLESEPEPVLESEPEPVLESEPESAMELTVEELLSAYAKDRDAADIKFAKKLLRVTGVVAMIDVKDMLDTHYIRLTTAERNLLWNVRCIFDKKHASVLQQLAIGQTATVQGIYNGSIIEIRMMNCIIV